MVTTHPAYRTEGERERKGDRGGKRHTESLESASVGLHVRHEASVGACASMAAGSSKRANMLSSPRGPNPSVDCGNARGLGRKGEKRRCRQLRIRRPYTHRWVLGTSDGAPAPGIREGNLGKEAGKGEGRPQNLSGHPAPAHCLAAATRQLSFVMQRGWEGQNKRWGNQNGKMKDCEFGAQRTQTPFLLFRLCRPPLRFSLRASSNELASRPLTREILLRNS